MTFIDSAIRTVPRLDRRIGRELQQGAAPRLYFHLVDVDHPVLIHVQADARVPTDSPLDRHDYK
jgi:hypothetical protein